MDHAAVLTGDLVRSTQADPAAVDRAMATLGQAAITFAERGNLTRPVFTRFRGDGWQVGLHWAGLTLRLVTFLLARLRATEPTLRTRIGIGIGTVDSWGTDNLGDARGPAFTASGHALDSLGKSGGLLIAFAPPRPETHDWVTAALEMLAYLSDRWSPEQAEAIALWVIRQMPRTDQDATLTALAEGIGITRQALSARLAIAGERPIMAAITAAEQTL